MKKFFFLLCCLCLISCAPDTKESYMSQFESFIQEVTDNHQTYSDSDWSKMNKKYDKFTNEWYNKFESELTVKDKVKVGTYQAKWAMYYGLNTVTDAVHDAINGDEVKGLEKDLKDLEKKARKIGEGLLDDAKDVLDGAKDAVDEMKDLIK